MNNLLILFPSVILCTLALFVSGLVLQQKSIRDIQAAYRPRLARQLESATASIWMSRAAESTAVPIVLLSNEMTSDQIRDTEQIAFDVDRASLLDSDDDLQLQREAIVEEPEAPRNTNDRV